ncbi:MAG: hypothetical protein RBT75_06985 [Anaerolineae bacterium]|jgi:hypothetical protein|nr:hypothetical protein [Anaerolineae bacterium]
MKLSKLLKVLIGVLTAWVVIAPLLLGGLWLFMFPFMMLSSRSYGDPGPLFFMLFGIFMFVAMLTTFMRWGMAIFYLTHVILNREGNDAARVLLGVGAFFLPVIAMPFYFFLYIWPEQPPAWALRKAPQEILSEVPAETAA